jgi:hypothetical protein
MGIKTFQLKTITTVTLIIRFANNEFILKEYI